jgi:DNA-binding MarR family transcriptional regulator
MRPSDAKLEQLLTGLHKVGLALRSDAREEGVETGLSPAQREILVLLRTRDRELRLADVATELGIHAPAASESVATLVEKGLVRKSRAKDDGRALALGLTAAGRRAAEERPQWTDLMLAAASELAPEERDAFLRGLVKMIKRLQDEGRIASARMCASCSFFRPNAHAGARKPHHCAFVDAPLADRDLRLDCAEHAPAPEDQRRRAWNEFLAATPRAR